MAVPHDLALSLLVGNGIPVSATDGVERVRVDLAPAYDFQRADGEVNWAVIATKYTDESALTFDNLEDTDSDGNPVVWQIRVTFLGRGDKVVGGGNSVTFEIPTSAGATVNFPEDVNLVDPVENPEYGPTWAAQAEASKIASAASAAAAAESAAAAVAVGTTNDTIIAGRINTPGSATATALTNTIATQVASLPIFVEHGSNASFARPSTPGNVAWVGTVRPLNMLTGDLWFQSATKAIEPPLNWMVDLDAGQLTLLDLVPVASFTDQSGNARHATQATSTKRPVFHAAAGSDPAFVRGDGVDDALQTAAFATPNQPFTLIVAFRMTSVEAGATIQDILAGITTSGTAFIALQQRGLSSAARYEMYLGNAGNGYVPTFLAEAGKWVVMSIVANGASTVVRVNGAPYALAGNPGVNAPTGLTLFAGSNGASAYADCDIVAVKMIAGTIPNLTDYEYALMSRCGLV